MPAESHPGRAEIGRFIAGALPPADNRRVVRHLLSGCASCRRTAAQLWQPPAAGLAAGGFGRALSAIADRAARIERQRREAAALLEELEAHSPARRLLLVLNSRRYRNWFLCERLVQRAFEAGLRDPESAVAEAETSAALAEQLVAADGDQSARDLAARAWAVVGNARRIGSDFGGAEEAFGKAAEHLAGGTGDPLEEANLACLLGSFRHNQRRFEEALDCFERSIRLSRSVGDQHLAGRALLEKATTLGEAGLPDEMVAALRQAVRLLDGAREPRLLLVAQHNLTWALKESGRLDEALATLQEILPLHARSAQPMDLLRLRWLEGKLAQAQGELERAGEAFREVRRGFVERRVPYDAALASLDLAAVFYQQNRIGEMKRLAAVSLPIFRALGVHREALAALALFEEATRRERVSLRWIGELASYLQRARSDPRLTFEPSA